MRKKHLFGIVVSLIITSLLMLSGCSLFGGTSDGGTTTTPSGDGENGDDENGQIAEDAFKLTGDIPFSLGSDFYIHLEVKSVPDSLNPRTCSFTAIRKDQTIYTNYTYIKYKDATEYAVGNYKEYYTEERILHEGINFRKSEAELTNTSGHLYTAYAEEWNTLVPDGETMATTIEYIQAFLNGNHVADTPYTSGHFVQTGKIPSDMSTQYISDISICTPLEMYEDGTENLTFGIFTNDDENYTPEQAFSASVKKYRGTYRTETIVMNVKTWGNIVVYAEQANGSNVLKKTVSCKYSSTVSQETFEAVLDAAGYTADPVIPEE